MSRYHLPVPMYIDVSQGVLLLYYTIVYISLDSMDKAVFNLFYDTYMVAYAIILPVKENNIAGAWGIVSVRPTTIIYKPVYTIRAVSKLGYLTVQHTALCRAP